MGYKDIEGLIMIIFETEMKKNIWEQYGNWGVYTAPGASTIQWALTLNPKSTLKKSPLCIGPEKSPVVESLNPVNPDFQRKARDGH